MIKTVVAKRRGRFEPSAGFYRPRVEACAREFDGSWGGKFAGGVLTGSMSLPFLRFGYSLRVLWLVAGKI
jgi:hypothetical protein